MYTAGSIKRSFRFIVIPGAAAHFLKPLTSRIIIVRVTLCAREHQDACANTALVLFCISDREKCLIFCLCSLLSRREARLRERAVLIFGHLGRLCECGLRLGRFSCNFRHAVSSGFPEQVRLKRSCGREKGRSRRGESLELRPI